MIKKSSKNTDTERFNLKVARALVAMVTHTSGDKRLPGKEIIKLIVFAMNI